MDTKRLLCARNASRVAALAVAALALGGCSQANSESISGQSNESNAEGGTLVYATGDAEPDCLDPHVGGNYPQALISTQYLEPLVGRSSHGEIEPWLATQWQVSADNLTWDFTLKDGVTFTDGTPFDAEAVKANIEHLQDPETGSSTGYLAVEKIEEVEVVDATHARFHLSEPDSALLESLSQQWTAMQSPAGIERGMEANCAAPIGTGPFIVDEWVPQEQITLVRNDDYSTPGPQTQNQGTAHLEKIVWRMIPDAATRYAALQSGEVNVIDNPQPDAIVAAEESETMDHIDAPRPGSSNRIELNSGQAPFDDAAVREAFVRSANPDSGIESLYMGTTKRSHSLLSSVEPMIISDSEPFGTDLDKANRLLDQAGWTEKDANGIRIKDGKKLTVRFPVSTNQSVAAEQSLFEQIQANVAQVGFEVILTPMDLSSWYAALGANEYEAVSAPYTKVGPDVLRILYHSDGIVPAPSGYFANHAQISSQQIDDVLDEAAATTNHDEREEFYSLAQELILSTYAVLPLYDQQNHFLTQGVEGIFTLGTVATPSFIDAQLTK